MIDSKTRNRLLLLAASAGTEATLRRALFDWAMEADGRPGTTPPFPQDSAWQPPPTPDSHKDMDRRAANAAPVEHWVIGYDDRTGRPIVEFRMPWERLDCHPLTFEQAALLLQLAGSRLGEAWVDCRFFLQAFASPNPQPEEWR